MTPPRIVGPRDGKSVDLGSIGARFMVYDSDSGGGFALVEHPMPPHHLAAPLHRHSREDEYSYVIEGRLGALLGDEVVYAEVGELAFKPRDQWHTFWNAGDTPCRILEIISPGGFEHYFDEIAGADGSTRAGIRSALRTRGRHRRRGEIVREVRIALPAGGPMNRPGTRRVHFQPRYVNPLIASASLRTAVSNTLGGPAAPLCFSATTRYPSRS